MVWSKPVTSFLARRAVATGALGTGVRAAARRTRGIDDMARRRRERLQAQVDNGRTQESIDDMTDDERAYFFDE